MNIRNLVNYSKKVEAGNIAFAKMGRKQKRLAIAKDAVAQLITGKATAQPGTYLEVSQGKFPESDYNNEYSESDYETIRNTIQSAPECAVCAKGAVVLSAIRCGVNPVGVDSYFGDRDLDCYTPEIPGFTIDTLHLMEEIFENTLNLNLLSDWDPDFDDAYELQFAQDPDARLFGILENIIEHEGDFKPRKHRSETATEKFVEGVSRRYSSAVERAEKYLTAV